MGNYIGRPNNEQNMQDIYARLERIEKIDLNNDGVISKEEFEIWKNSDLKNIKDDIRRENDKEIESLKSINKELERSLREKNELIERLGENLENDEDVKELITMLSKEQISKYVEELLANEETNIKYLPDFAERQLYRNFFKLSINLMNKIMSSMSFELINHKLHIGMIPNNP